jgi:hypothetical protein
MFDLICKDTIVAVRPNIESLENYFLLIVTSNGVVQLEQNIISSGQCYAKDTRVVNGNFFNLPRSDRKGHYYKKDDVQESVIPVGSILYVGIDLEESRNLHVLRNEDHEDIMCWIEHS